MLYECPTKTFQEEKNVPEHQPLAEMLQVCKLVHPKMKTVSFNHPHIVPNLYNAKPV